MDRLNIIAHDKFQEIVDEANRADSPIRLQQVILEPEKDLQKTVTVVVHGGVLEQIGGQPPIASIPVVSADSTPTPASSGSPVNPSAVAPIFTTEAERKIAQMTYEVIKRHESLPSSSHLLRKEVAAQIVKQVEEALSPGQLELPNLIEKPNVAEIVAKTTEIVVRRSRADRFRRHRLRRTCGFAV